MCLRVGLSDVNKFDLLHYMCKLKHVGLSYIIFSLSLRCKDAINAGRENDIDINIDDGKWFTSKLSNEKSSTSPDIETVIPPVLGWKPFPSRTVPSNFNYGHIYHYLLESVKLLGEDGSYEDTDLSHMTSKPLTKGEQYVKSGNVHSLMDTIKTGTGHYFLKGKVDASMRKEQRNVHVTISNLSGAILDASCTCPASSLGRCNHVAALLLFLDKHCKENGHEPVTCTGKQCKWNQGQKRKNPSKINDTNYSLYKEKAANLSDFDPRPKDHRQVTDEAINSFASNLKYHSILTGKSSMWSSLLTIKYHDFELDEKRKCELQELAMMFFTNIKSECNQFGTDVFMVPDTIEQSQSSKWSSSRWFRITASTAKQANSLGSFLSEPPFAESTYRKLYNFASCHVWNLHPFSTSDTLYGLENEDQARIDYLAHKNTDNPGLKVIKTGFWVNKLWPELGCSPDGIVYDPTEAEMYGLLEIKCPKLLKRIAPKEIFQSLENKELSNSDLYSACFGRPTMANKDLELKTTHSYYFQIQFQLAITGLKWCDFVLWSPVGQPNIERIRRDEQLIVSMIGNVTTLWMKVIAPEFFEMRVPRKLFPFIVDV